MVMTLTVMGREPDSWVALAIRHALRDIDDHFLGVGPEGAAGYGDARVVSLSLNGAKADVRTPEPLPLATVRQEASR